MLVSQSQEASEKTMEIICIMLWVENLINIQESMLLAFVPANSTRLAFAFLSMIIKTKNGADGRVQNEISKRRIFAWKKIVNSITLLFVIINFPFLSSYFHRIRYCSFSHPVLFFTFAIFPLHSPPFNYKFSTFYFGKGKQRNFV